jgi:hypothetical protein
VSLASKLRAAGPQGRALAAEALAWLLAARLLLQVLPFTTVRRLLKAAAGALVAPPVPAERVAWALGAAGGRLPGWFHGCLPQALAAEAMLGRHRVPAELKIGVRRAPSSGPRSVEAHAWVLSGNHVVSGWLQDLASYVPLAPAFGSRETPIRFR